ncbi:exopolysaccharide biosynthesis polyprenyl glycosylphosphotransferase [Erysipelotrichaceae bacterium HCN-30851]
MREKLTNFKRTILMFIRIANLAVLTAIFAYIWYTYYSEPILPGAAIEFFRRGNWLIIAIYALLLGAFTQLNGGYKVGDYRISEMIYSNFISITFINFIYYFLIALMWRAFPLASYLVLLSIIQYVYMFFWCIISNKIYFKLYKPRKVIYFYQSDEPSIVLEKMHRRHDKYDVQEVFRIFDTVNFYKAIESFDAVVLDRVSAANREACIEACYMNKVRLYMVPSFDDVIIESSMMINLLDTPLYLMKNRGLSFEQHLIKRGLDLLIGIPLFIVACPFMLLTAIAIKLDDHGPVLYKQERLTIGGRVFKIYKFRSMRVDAEKDGKAVLMCQNDDRITRVGRFIRKCRLDELPQLINVIKGDMSLVGPRPERPQIAEEYYQTMPEFKFRLMGKAGITGYAQVMGKYNTTPYDKLVFDLMYLENYSILFDFKIMLLTLKTLFNVDATEGVLKRKDKE